ncbi:MAG TPA: c-type cytochrome domain-containing protein [Planctomycetota bacterium]|nr:c-type cytochrome domain-containing protein [Planctomycetota bacterium]
MYTRLRSFLVLGGLLLGLAATSTAQEKKPGADSIDFQKQVWPILEKTCLKCHATASTGSDGKVKKPKGGVVLDSKQGITTSKKGKLVVAKKPADSLLYNAISLPADHEDRMPPAKEGDALAKDKQELIFKWIEQGANFGSWTGKAKEGGDGGSADKEGPAEKGGEKGGEKGKGDKPEEKPNDKPKPGEKPKVDPLVRLKQGVKPLAPATLAPFADGPFQVQSVGDDNPLLRVSCAGRTDEVTDYSIASLQPLCEHITELDLGRTSVGDAACAVIAKMPRLTVLDLRQSQVGDHGVAALAACRELRSLNLFGTKAGDYSVATLSALKHLEDLYVWQTEVSAAAVVRLREAVPNVRVVLAAELPEPMAETPGNGRRRPGNK